MDEADEEDEQDEGDEEEGGGRRREEEGKEGKTGGEGSWVQIGCKSSAIAPAGANWFTLLELCLRGGTARLSVTSSSGSGGRWKMWSAMLCLTEAGK